MKQRAAQFFRQLQSEICAELASLDGKSQFAVDDWLRPDAVDGHGGGGKTRILTAGAVFERAGVNFSEVYGTLPAEMSERLVEASGDVPFYATGISLVLHPYSPLVPTTHANFRYLEAGEKKWFGGGSDMTPYYFYAEDAEHFHREIKTVCDKFSPDYYPAFKKQCDEYFYLPHRGEARGVGGVFFDYLGRDSISSLEHYFELLTALGKNFLSSYLPIVVRRKDEPWTEQQKKFQLMRRGRYVEFNLLYDRGTQFGLKTNGRTESILMSLPPNVCWEYNYQPQPGSREEELLEVVRTTRQWV